MSETKEVIWLPNMELTYNDSFFYVLKYIYTGTLILKNQEMYRIFDLMLIAKTLELNDLREEMSLLLENSINLENVALIYEKSNSLNQRRLKMVCEQFIDQNAEILIAKQILLHLSSQCLKQIISRDSFSVNEIKIFKLVEEWHIFHNQTNDLNIELIKEIRFKLIPSEELIDLAQNSKLVSDRKLVDKINKIINLRKGSTIQLTRKIIYSTTASLKTNNSAVTKEIITSKKVSSTTTKTTIQITTVSVPITNTTAIKVSSAKTLKTKSKINDYFRNTLASGSYSGSIKIWNVNSGKCIMTLTGQSKNISKEVRSLQLIANNTLASGSEDASINIWNLESGECIRTLIGHSQSVESLQLLANNQLASGSWDTSIKIWDINSGECTQTFLGHLKAVKSLQLVDENTLASGSHDNLIKIWNSYSGVCIKTLSGHSGGVSALQLLSNNRLASASLDTLIKIWDLNSGECIRTLTGHSNSVLTLQSLPNNILASGSWDNSIRIWNADTFECVLTLNDHTRPVVSLQLINNKTLASGSMDDSIKIWNLYSCDCIQTITGFRSSLAVIQPHYVI